MENNNKNKTSLKNKVLSVLFLTWFIGSIVAMIVFSNINEYYSIMFFGQYFIVFGLIPMFAGDKEKIIGIPFLLVGAACIIVPFLMMHPEIFTTEINWDRVIAILMMSAFVIAGLCMTFIPIIKKKQLEKVCTLKVCARVVDYNSIRGDNGGRLYAPVYEFQFNGKDYKVSKEEYTNVNVVEKDTIVELMINPDNPEEYLDDFRFSIGIIIMGVLFLIVSVPILYLMIIGKLL